MLSMMLVHSAEVLVIFLKKITFAKLLHL